MRCHHSCSEVFTYYGVTQAHCGKCGIAEPLPMTWHFRVEGLQTPTTVQQYIVAFQERCNNLSSQFDEVGKAIKNLGAALKGLVV